MNPYVTCTVCGVKLNTTNIQKKFCDDCRKARDRESRRRSNQRRRDAGYKQPSKKGKVYGCECLECILAIDCLERVKRNYDPYCWCGEDTNNRYYYLYEKAKVEAAA